MVVFLFTACDGGVGPRFSDDPVEYSLTIQSDGDGEVVPSVGVHRFEENTVVNLEAIPDAGWEFSHWVGPVSVSDNAITSVVMTANRTVKAFFVPEGTVARVTLTIEIEGNGSVIPEAGSHDYDLGEEVEIEAIPDTGWSFSYWEGDEVSDSQSPVTTIQMDGDKTVKAVFSEIDLKVVEIDSGISSATTWESNTIYVISSNISVTAILTIEPGTIIKFGQGRYMTISSTGGLRAEGTASQPIIFTSLLDDKHGGDTNQDGDLTSPAAGDWAYIRISGTANIDHCRFYYGGSSSLDSTLYIDGTAAVRNSVFAYNLGDSYGTIDARSGATIENNIFYSNVKPIRLNPSLPLDDSNIFHNPADPSERNQFDGIFIYGSSLSSDVTWEETEIAFVISSHNLTVSVDYKLTIEEGVTVKVDNRYIIVNGRLDIKGSEEKPVVFTSYKDDNFAGDSNGDGDFTSPEPGDWSYIRVNGSANVEYTKFYYGGGSSLDCTLYIDGTAAVRNSVFAYNRGDSYGTIDARSGATIENNIFYSNVKPINLNPSLSLDDSNIFHNPADPSERNQFEGIFIYGSSVSSDVTWEETEIAFVISSHNLTIGEDYKLVLGNNVILKFNDRTLYHNNNIENYNGDGVFFTSYKDDSRGGDSNGDGDFSSPAVGDWFGIYNNAASPRYYESWSNILYAGNP